MAQRNWPSGLSRRGKRATAWLPALQEVGILKGLNYDCNIVQFYGVCLQPGGDPMLVCEYMEGATTLLP